MIYCLNVLKLFCLNKNESIVDTIFIVSFLKIKILRGDYIMSLQRSSLYSIVPIGIGTVEAESLCSYISRLADIHCVTVGDIMKYLIAPKINKEYINNIGISGGNGFINHRLPLMVMELLQRILLK